MITNEVAGGRWFKSICRSVVLLFFVRVVLFWSVDRGLLICESLRLGSPYEGRHGLPSGIYRRE